MYGINICFFLIYASFWHYDKIPFRNNLKEGRFIFGSWFHLCCGLVVRQSIMVERVWWGGTRMLTSWWPEA
jgi:hypothetical protein